MVAEAQAVWEDDSVVPDPYVVRQRLGAILIDSGITTVLAGLLGLYFRSFHLRVQNPHHLQSTLTLGINGQSADLPVRLGLAVVLYFTYFALFEMALGATPGKLITGLHVDDLSGRPASAWQAFARNLLRPIDAVGAYMLGGFVMMVSGRRQRLGDHAAATMVVWNRTVRPPAAGRGALRPLGQSTAVLLSLVLCSAAISYFVPPSLVDGHNEAFYPDNTLVAESFAPGANRLDRIAVSRGAYTPGAVTYHLRFDLRTGKHNVRRQCAGTVTFVWNNPLSGWSSSSAGLSCPGPHSTGPLPAAP